jgi:hypothetical protein
MMGKSLRPDMHRTLVYENDKYAGHAKSFVEKDSSILSAG